MFVVRPSFSYTHFTSPIRRYPDLIVHRLLAAALGHSPPPNLSGKKMEKIAEHCNEAKTTSRIVGDSSTEVFFSELIRVSLKVEIKHFPYYPSYYLGYWEAGDEWSSYNGL